MKIIEGVLNTQKSIADLKSIKSTIKTETEDFLHVKAMWDRTKILYKETKKDVKKAAKDAQKAFKDIYSLIGLWMDHPLIRLLLPTLGTVLGYFMLQYFIIPIWR